MEGTLKGKDTSQQPTTAGGAAGGGAAHDKKKWEDTFTHDGNGRYAMQPWQPCHIFRCPYRNLNRSPSCA
jgi:hypothetical protein